MAISSGDVSQILILTSTPGRYQGIGRATVIPLQRSTPAAVGTVNAISGAAYAPRPVEDGAWYVAAPRAD